MFVLGFYSKNELNLGVCFRVCVCVGGGGGGGVGGGMIFNFLE